MFREMRKKNRQVTNEEAIDILKNGSNGVLSVYGDNGYPYGVPVSYSYDDGKIYFHGFITGHKLDGIKTNEKVCFTIVTKDEVQAKDFATNYESVIVFGKAKIINDKDAKIPPKMKIAEKYSKGYEKEAMEYIEASMKGFCIVEITIDHITGKRR